MATINLLATTSAGSTSLATIGTIAAGGDGQSSAGVPNIVPATLVQWGVQSIIADTILEAKLVCNDQIDVQNGEDFSPGASSLMTSYQRFTNIPFISSTRSVQLSQNTGAGLDVGFTLDLVSRGKGVNPGFFAPNQVHFEQTASGATTAQTWLVGTAATPTTPLKSGTYAILGFKVMLLTTDFMALVRFSHADFNGAKPGLAVKDTTTTAITNTDSYKDLLDGYEGYQFVQLSNLLGTPVCPTFTVTAAGTGLSVDILTIVASTPRIEIYLAKIA